MFRRAGSVFMVTLFASCLVAYAVGPRGALLPFMMIGWATRALIKAAKPFEREILGTKKARQAVVGTAYRR